MKKYLSFLLAILFSFCILAGCAQKNDSEDPPLYSDESILITINPQFNDKIYTIEDFADVNCIELEDLTVGEVEPNRVCRIFHIRIGNPSEENVKAAVEILRQREDVNSAELCYQWQLYDNYTNYPSYFKFSNLISVGASTENDTKKSNSNFGATRVDIFAPGNNILSCYPVSRCTSGNCPTETHADNGYHYDGGTSMAAPYVTGVAALLLSKYPTMTTEQLKEEILEHSTEIAALQDYCLSGKRVNAYRIFTNISCVHSYTHHYTSVSSTGHNAYCSCGDYIPQSHTFTQSGSTLVCSKCGYSSISLNNQGNEIELQ